jgi:hypothetical protein
MSELDQRSVIAAIDINITNITINIEREVASKYDDEGEHPVTALQRAQETWPSEVHIPSTKDEAIRVLENPESTRLDKLGATLFAEMYKKRQLQKAHEIKPENDGMVFYAFDSD